jgi:hypothetical protein
MLTLFLVLNFRGESGLFPDFQSIGKLLIKKTINAIYEVQKTWTQSYMNASYLPPYIHLHLHPTHSKTSFTASSSSYEHVYI